MRQPYPTRDRSHRMFEEGRSRGNVAVATDRDQRTVSEYLGK